jgi:hypothetical protein
VASTAAATITSNLLRIDPAAASDGTAIRSTHAVATLSVTLLAAAFASQTSHVAAAPRSVSPFMANQAPACMAYNKNACFKRISGRFLDDF